MLQPDAAKGVADGQQKFIAREMPRGKHAVSLGQQLLVRFNLLGRGFKLGSGVGKHIQVNRRAVLRVELDALEVLARP